MWRQDSIVQEPIVIEDSMAKAPARPQTPYQVLRLLPKDATPAQQDSAIQAWFQPGEITYSSRPDTLHLPGHDKGRDLKEVNIPQYYRESFFSKDSLLHPELNGGRYGVAGDPVPYAIKNDNLLTGLLLACLILVILAFSHSRDFFARQAKNFFYIPKHEGFLSETSSEYRIQFALSLQTCLLLSVLCYFYADHFIADTYILSDQYLLILIFFGMILGYHLLRFGLYAAVNAIFFGSKKNIQFLKMLLLLTAIEGILLLPVVLLQTYFDLAILNVVHYTLFVIVLTEILIFYKCYVIFFKQNGVILQIILYFCALEIIPLLALWGALVMITDYLKINF